MTTPAKLNEFIIQADGNYLKKNIRAFYHTNYSRMNTPGNPDYVNDLKNTFNNFSSTKLDNAVQKLQAALENDLPKILRKLKLNHITVCVVPRAFALRDYEQNQLLFKESVQKVISNISEFSDGTGYITRHTKTKTTHLKNATSLTNYDNDGPDPYPGITIETCHMSKNISGKNILLIDDIYTTGVKIDEDAIQALLENGAASVVFYSIGKTI
jgi:hypothetical protein